MARHITDSSRFASFDSAGFSWTAFTALALSGCAAIEGSGELTTESRSIASAQHVEVCCGFEVQFVQGPDPTLVITTDDNLQDELLIVDHAGTLEIGWRDPWDTYRPSRPVQVDLILPEPRSLESSGGGRLSAQDLEVEHLAVEVSGGGHLELAGLSGDSLTVTTSGGSSADLSDLDLNRFELDSSGGGLSELTGICSEFRAQISGGGELAAFDLLAERVVLDQSGGGRAELTAASELDVDASGGGRVLYRGSPRVHSDVSGGSSVEEASAE